VGENEKNAGTQNANAKNKKNGGGKKPLMIFFVIRIKL